MGRGVERVGELGGVSGSGSSVTPASRNRSAASVATGSQTPSAASASAPLASTCARRPVDHERGRGVEHDDPVDDVDRGVEVVLDEHDGAVALARDFAQHGVDLIDAGGVEVGRGFVEHEHRGRPIASAHAMASRCRPPPESRRGSRRDGPIGPRAQRPLGACQHLIDRHQQVLGAERHLVEHGAGDDLGVGVLEHHRDVLAQHSHGVVTAVEPRDAHRPLEFGGNDMGHEPVERERERRLAAPRRAEQQYDLSRRDRQGHAVGRRSRRTLVADAHVVEFEQRVRWAWRSPDRGRRGRRRAEAAPTVPARPA